MPLDQHLKMNNGVPDSPLVSILISNYNYGQFLRAAIDSALNQTYRRTEVIVVDDGSTDNSREIIAGYGDRIIPVLKDNGGHSSAVNAGFAASHGDIICLLDSDDLFLPEKVSRVVEAWKRNPDSCLVYHQLQMINADGKKLGRPWPRTVWSGDIKNKVERSGGWWPYPGTNGLNFSRSYVERLLPIPTNGHRLFPDTHLAAPAPFFGSVTGVPEPLGMVRFHGQAPADSSGVQHFHQTGSSPNKPDQSRLLVKQHNLEFNALKETLRRKLDLDPPISLEDCWDHQLHRRIAGEPVTLSQVITSIVKCPALPLSMKWREVAKVVLRHS